MNINCICLNLRQILSKNYAIFGGGGGEVIKRSHWIKGGGGQDRPKKDRIIFERSLGGRYSKIYMKNWTLELLDVINIEGRDRLSIFD